MSLRISIVTPSYQQGHYLEDTLRSVLEQAYGDVEHLVMDGGSTDSSLELLERYGRLYPERLTYVSEADAGQSDAINKGLKKSTGDVVAWLNSDDVYYPGALEHVAELFEAHPDVDAVYGKGVFLDEHGVYLTDFPHNGPYDAERLLGGDAFLLQPTVFWRRRVMEDVGLLDTSLHYSMDYELWCRMAHAGVRFLYDEENYYAAARFYRETKTASGQWKRARELRQVGKQYSHRNLPGITLYSYIEAAMATPLMTKLYRPLKKAIHGQDIDYWEIPFPDTHGPTRIQFPYYRPLRHLEIDFERLGRPGDGPATVTVESNGHSTNTFKIGERRKCLSLDIEPVSNLVDFTLEVKPDHTTYRLHGMHATP